MALNLKRRLHALERVGKPTGCCEACGYAVDAPMHFRLTLAAPPDDGPDVCPSCGRQLLVRIVIGDAVEVCPG